MKMKCKIKKEFKKEIIVISLKENKTFDECLNDLLEKALGSVEKLNPFSLWARKSLVFDEKMVLSEMREMFMADNPSIWGFSSQEFNTWIKEYCAEDGLNFKFGRSAEGYWVRLSKNEIGAYRQKITSKDFNVWADSKKLTLSEKIYKKQVHREFILKYPSIKGWFMQKECKKWLEGYITTRGYLFEWAFEGADLGWSMRVGVK